MRRILQKYTVHSKNKFANNNNNYVFKKYDNVHTENVLAAKVCYCTLISKHGNSRHFLTSTVESLYSAHVHLPSVK